MNMLWKMVEPKYVANPVLARALDILFILHADHEQNCSTNVMRAIGSSQADPYVAIARRCGRALRSAARRRQRRSAADARRDRLEGERAGLHREGQVRRAFKLMGFGHRVYKNYDPRARIIKWTADRVFGSHGPQRTRSRSHSNWSASRLIGRLLRQAQALPQRGLLLRHHL